MNTDATVGLNRTNHPKFTSYTGDGSGRDQYIVFCNGGLQPQRNFNFKNTRPQDTFNASPNKTKYGGFVRPSPQKMAGLTDYIPDGNGRDTYIIQNQGLKRDFITKHSVFENYLRTQEQTPTADQKSQKHRDPWRVDITNYRGWPSRVARQQNAILFENQKLQIERLSVTRNSPKSIKQARKNMMNDRLLASSSQTCKANGGARVVNYDMDEQFNNKYQRTKSQFGNLQSNLFDQRKRSMDQTMSPRNQTAVSQTIDYDRRHQPSLNFNNTSTNSKLMR